MRIQTRIIIIVSIVLLLLIAVSTVINIYNMHETASKRVEAVELPAALGEISGGITSEILPAVIVSKSLVHSNYIQDWLNGGESATSLNAFSDYLAKVKSSNSALAVFLVSEKTKNFYFDKGILKTISPSSEKDSWYYNFIKSGKEFELNIDTDETSGKVSVFVNYRIEDNGKLLGVGGIGIALDAIVGIIGEYRIGDTGTVFLADSSGVVKVHSDKSLLGKGFAKSYGLESQVEQDLISGNNISHTAYSNISNMDMIFSSTKLALVDWVLVAQISENDLYSGINKALKNGTLISIAIAVLFLLIMTLVIRSFFKPINIVAQALVDIGQGDQDLTQRIDYKENNEVGQLAEGFNNFVEKIEHVVRSANVINKELDKRVDHATHKLSQTVVWAKDQEVMTEQVTVAITEMEATSTEIAGNASDAATSTEKVSQGAEHGADVIKQAIATIADMSATIENTSGTITELAKDVSAISQVVGVIQGISEQINLLALNAAIEAARAGEYGRGFAVVADEVRSLSQRTQQSTEEIISTIARLEKGSNNAVQAIDNSIKSTQLSTDKINQAGSEFDIITQAVSSMSGMNLQIATATNEQTLVTADVNHHMLSIAEISKKSTSSSSDNVERFAEIKEKLQDLSSILSQFKTTDK